MERTKVQGRWLYFDPNEPNVDEALDILQSAVEVVLSEWLLNPAQYLVGQALHAAKPWQSSQAAAKVLLHELCARHRLDGIALMSRSLQPYLAFYRLSDQGEVERQVDAMRALFRRHGRVNWRDLPEPAREVARQVWRTTVVAHGFWLGLGQQPEPGVLETW